jgi:sugar phosphate isomerase/epimerase
MPKVPHVVAVELIAALGFEAHDLLLIGNSSAVHLDDVRSDIRGWAARLDERIRSRGLAIPDVFGIPDGAPAALAPNHPDPNEVERSHALFQDMLDFAVLLGCPGMTMLPGVVWPGEDHADSLSRSAAELARRVEAAAARGVRFSIEPHVGSVCPTPEDCLRLCELAPGLELTLDYSHFVYQGFSEAEVEPLLAHTRHFHARAAVEGQLQSRVSESSIDWERVIDAMREYGYDGYISLEFAWTETEEGLSNVDVLSESLVLRDRLRAKLDERPV